MSGALRPADDRATAASQSNPQAVSSRAGIPSAWPTGYADAFIQFTPGQESALEAYDAAQRFRDDDMIRETRYHLEAWDRHFGRESTIVQRDRRNAAIRRWGAYIFQDGAGI